MVDVTTHQLPWHTAGHQPRQRTFAQSSKLQDVLYEIRGPVHDHAARLESEGHRILKLNIGNPAPFGFEAPDVIMRDMIQALPYAQGYSDSKGILPARRAVVTRYELVEEATTIAVAARELSPRERRVLALRFAGDLTQTQIAQEIGVSQMQVSRILRRALTQLRQLTQADES